MSTPLLWRTPVTESALAAIMKDVGLTDEQVVKRFGYKPEDVPVRGPSSHAP
ncbi:hypothetical protein [Methylobacterium phyllostachyos]|nr:hypothetical protein [Methylobacterium phyllostachyos]